MSSDILFPIKQSAIALLMNTYCLHQEYMVMYGETQVVIGNILEVMCHNFLRNMHSDV
jgi:hypothetical protein